MKKRNIQPIEKKDLTAVMFQIDKALFKEIKSTCKKNGFTLKQFGEYSFKIGLEDYNPEALVRLGFTDKE